MIMKLLIFAVLTSCFQSLVLSQDYTLLSSRVFEDSRELSLAFAGGLRSPQFSVADLNLDGISDVLVYDREGAIVLPFIRDSITKKLKYTPKLRAIFPKPKNWMLLRDYNKDGIVDIFCSPTAVALPGIEVWKGVNMQGFLQFERVKFSSSLPDVLTVPIGSTVVQIYVSVADLPDIRDLDGDGDLDILSFEPAGSTVYFHKNMAVERKLNLDSLHFILGDVCYGKFVESGFSQEIKLSPNNSNCASSFFSGDDILLETRHSGSTITAFQNLWDTIPNLLIGDISYAGLIHLVNGGTKNLAWMIDQNIKFPDVFDPVNIQLFNAAYFDDFNSDGSKELIIAPNDRFTSQTLDNIWHYDVRLENGKNNYILRSRNFLTDEMLYFGENSAPVFFDVDADGLIDIVIGAGGRSPNGIDRSAQLVLLKNVGKRNEAQYRIESLDYLGMSAFRNNSLSFSPAFGDLDGDRDVDLVVGDDKGRLYYFENQSNKANVLDFKNPIYGAFDIRVSAWARPTIYDQNNDGLADLIIGEQNFNSFNNERASLNYFQNIGITGQAQFNPEVESSPNDPLYGKVFIKDPSFISNYSSPRVIDSKGQKFLITGSENGRIYQYKLSGTAFEQVTDQLGNLNEGFQSVVDLADIDDDGYFEIAIGTRRGGLAVFNTDIVSDQSTAVSSTEIANLIILRLSPNPVSKTLKLEWETLPCHNCELSIYNLSGQQIYSRRINSSNDVLDIDVEHLQSGTYLLSINDKYAQKFIKIE